MKVGRVAQGRNTVADDQGKLFIGPSAPRDFGNAPSSVSRKTRAAINTPCPFRDEKRLGGFAGRDKNSSVNARYDPFIFLIPREPPNESVVPDDG